MRIETNEMKPEPKVILRGVYKIFGPRSTQMMTQVRNGLDKETLLADHGHVLGLQDINVVMQAGEIIETGRHSQLLAAEGTYAALYRMQFNDEPTAV